MAKFNFISDKKVTVWERTQFVIEAETEEEARKIAAQKTNPDSLYDDDVEIVNTDILVETIEYMTPTENDDQPTVEIYINDPNVETNLINTNA